MELFELEKCIIWKIFRQILDILDFRQIYNRAGAILDRGAEILDIV